MKIGMQDGHRYDDIIYMPHHVSDTHPHMSCHDRAAQFSPFAALTGFEEAVQETGRVTENMAELDEAEMEMLDAKFRILKEHLEEHPEITITRFLPDERKEGGAYVTVSGRVKKLDEYEKAVIMENGERIPLDRIVDMFFEGAGLVEDVDGE